MHVLDKSLGQPAEQELADHIRKMVEAALFMNDKLVLMNVFHCIHYIDTSLNDIRAESIKHTSVTYATTDLGSINWVGLEDQSKPFDAMQRLLDVAKCKLVTAMQALDK